MLSWQGCVLFERVGLFTVSVSLCCTDTTQDVELAGLLASLAEEESPAASQALSEVCDAVSRLEEQDSVLAQLTPQSPLTTTDQHETLEMSQKVWTEDNNQQQ